MHATFLTAFVGVTRTSPNRPFSGANRVNLFAECTCFETFTRAPRERRESHAGCTLVETTSRAMSALAALDIAFYLAMMTLFFSALRKSRCAPRRPIDR